MSARTLVSIGTHPTRQLLHSLPHLLSQRFPFVQLLGKVRHNPFRSEVFPTFYIPAILPTSETDTVFHRRVQAVEPHAYALYPHRSQIGYDPFSAAGDYVRGFRTYWGFAQF